MSNTVIPQVFHLVVELAARPDLLRVAPLSMVDGDGQYSEHLEIIRTTLHLAYRAVGSTAPEPGTFETLLKEIDFASSAQLALAGKIENAVNTELNRREEAGYLYGLAMGLRVAAGGGR